MNDITYAVSVDVNNPIIPYNVYVANVLDSNVRYLEITLYQNGNIIALSNTATATASLVTDNVLVDDSVNCTISDNIITVPLEDLQRHGNLDVQVTVTEGTKVLAIPFPIQVRVTPNIAENAQIDENSLGSYAEVVHEIAEARGTYTTLHNAIAAKLSAAPGAVDTENLADESITVEKVADDLAEVINAKAPASTAYTFDRTTTNVTYNATNPKIIYTNALVNGKNAFVLTTANNYYQIALCYDGTEYARELTAGGSTTYKPWALVNNENTGNKQSSITAVNKESTTLYPSIKAVVDYLVANYENLSNKLTSANGIDEDSTDTEYPTAKAVYDFSTDILNGVNGEITNELMQKYTILAKGTAALSFNWATGGFDTQDGVTLNPASTTRIYEEEYIVGDDITTLTWQKSNGSGLRLWVFKYGIDGTMLDLVDYHNSPYVLLLEKGYMYRFNIYKADIDIQTAIANFTFSLSVNPYNSNLLLKTSIQNELDTINQSTAALRGDYVPPLTWSSGGMDTTTGQEMSTASRIKCNEFIEGIDNSYFEITSSDSDIKLFFFKYDMNGNFVEYQYYNQQNFLIPMETGYQYRFNLFKGNGISENDYTAYTFHIVTDIYQTNPLLKQHIDGINTLLVPNIHLMDEYNAVVGRELNFYWCQIFDCMNWKALEVIPYMASSSNFVTARQYDDRFSVTPTQSGDFTLTFALKTIKNNQYTDLATKTITVHAYPDSVPSSNKKVMFIGDSRTDYSRINTYAKNQYSNNITMLGTRGTEPYCHEGRYGWSANTYCTQASRTSPLNNQTVYNAFWNPTSSQFDFSYYMNQQNYGGVDYVNILLGVNNSYKDTEINYIEQMIQSIHEYDSNIIVSVMTEYQLPNKPYYSGSFTPLASRRYWTKVINKFSGRENENIYIIPAGQEIDDNYDWTHQTVYASQLNHIETDIISDNIHCTYGFDKLSNAWLVFFIARENAREY